MFRMLSYEMKKYFTNFFFYIGIIAGVLLCFSSEMYTEFEKGKHYTLIDCLLSFSQSFMENDIIFERVNICSRIFSGYLLMFSPIIVSLCYAFINCTESKSGYTKFSVSRCNKKAYIFVKYISGILIGGITMLMTTLIFGGIVYFLFPKFNDGMIISELEDMYYKYINFNEFERFIPICMYSFEIGMVYSLPTIILSSFIKNIYIITCVPFLIYFYFDISLIFEQKDKSTSANNYVILICLVMGFAIFYWLMNHTRDWGKSI